MQINKEDRELIFDIASRCIEEKYSREIVQQLIKEGRTPRDLINKVKKEFLGQILTDEGMWSLLQLQLFEGKSPKQFVISPSISKGYERYVVESLYCTNL